MIFGPHPTLPHGQEVPGLFPRGTAAGGVMLTTHLHLELTRMSGVIHVFPQYAFVATIGTTLLFMRNLYVT
jgi:hypothetical protein